VVDDLDFGSVALLQTTVFKTSVGDKPRRYRDPIRHSLFAAVFGSAAASPFQDFAD
jgi:hypothetical protein